MTIQKWRTFSRLLLMLLVTVHIYTWYSLGIHKVGSIGIEAFFAGLSNGVINAGVIFWVLAFISALILGRVFCGWFCWFGGYQDLISWGIGDRFKFKIPRHILLYLGLIPFVSLGLKMYSSWIINWLADVPGAFNFNLAFVEPWGGQQTGISILFTLVLYGPVLMYVFGRRAWCRHLCPIGALLSVFSKLSPTRFRLTSEDCSGCGRCTKVCDMEIDVAGELKSYGEVQSPSCIVCFRCSDVCPEKALSYTMKRPGAQMAPKAASISEKLSSKRRTFTAFDLIITLLWVSIVFSFTFSGLRQSAPQEIKAIMTPGLLLLIYGLALLSRWVLRKTNWLKNKP